MLRRPLFLILFTVLTGVFFSFETQVPNQDNDPFVVVLDAGHGGHDPGNLGNGYMEKNIALNIVLTVGEYLEQHGIKVVYTRKDDTFVDLHQRGQIANKADAQLFVSVHCDSHSSDAQGAGTFVLGLHANEQNFEIAKKENSVIYLEDNYETRYAEYDINSPESIIGLTIMQEEFLDQSIMLAKMMQDNFAGTLKRTDRKVKQAGFIVLHQTFMPSVLVETGFLTNKQEGSYLNSGKGQQEMGRAIAEAILTYRNNLLGNTAPPVSQAPEQAVTEIEIPLGKEVATVSKESPTPAKEPGVLAGSEKPKVEVKKETEGETATEPPANTGQSREEIRESVTLPGKEEVGAETGGAEPGKPESGIMFKVQLLASSKKIPLQAEAFNGLNQISVEPVNNLYRYLYGNTASYREALLMKANADAKGYTSSYIVAYREGERIPVSEALKYAPD